MLAYERQALLTSLQKLSDQHTRQKAMDECTKFAERLDAATLPGFLGVLHTTNDRHTVKCRSGVARLYGLVAHFHPDLIAPHLARVTDTLVARIKDKDGNRELREACATALGEIVKELQTPHAVAQCLRPLLPALSETIEPVQAAAALSLACVLQGAGEVGDVAAGRVTAALLRALGHCCVGARGALLDAAAALLSHSPQSARLHAPSFVAPLLSACAAADAGARRGGADALRVLVGAQPEAAAEAKTRAMPALHALRADKHRLVREAATAATATWRRHFGDEAATAAQCQACLPVTVAPRLASAEDSLFFFCRLVL